MKTPILFLALSLCAAAQTSTDVSGVTLSGPVADPTIENHTTKPIVAAMVLYFTADGKEYTGDEHMFILDRPNYLAPGDSQEIRTFAKGAIARSQAAMVAANKVAAVIFSDGEFRGGDDREATNFRDGMERRFQSMRAVFELAKSRDWSQIKALYDADSKGDLWKAAAASRLLGVHDKGGDAVNSYKHYGNLPSNIWKGKPLLNKLKTVPGFQQIAAWFAPSAVYAANGDHAFCCSSYYGQLSYYCDDGSGNPACPGLAGETPFVGIQATCVAIPPAFAYQTGLQIDFAQDLQSPPTGKGEWMQMTASATSSAPYTLDSKGTCKDLRLFGFQPEYAEYNKFCEDTPSTVPHKVSDTTQNICGTTALGYM